MSERAPSLTALGTVCAAASTIAGSASASEDQAAHWSLTPRMISTTIPVSVASMTAATSRFIGRAAVVTLP